MRRRLPHTLNATLTFAACLLLLVGCGGNEETAGPADHAGTGDALPDGIMLSSAPDGAAPVQELKTSAEPGDEVVVRVTVGGRADPIVAGRASAVTVDAAFENACMSEDDHCKTPWDYCCAVPEALSANMATVQVVDEDGRVIAADLSEYFQPLSTLVVKGIVGPRPDPNVLSINAAGIYVEPETP